MNSNEYRIDIDELIKRSQENPDEVDSLDNIYDTDEMREEFKAPASAAPSTASAVNIGNGLQIVDNLTTINRSTSNNSKKYLVIHYTAGTVDNGSAAYNTSMYFKSTYRGASAHFCVDSTSTIYRSVPENQVAWHIGGNKYPYTVNGGKYYGKAKNSNSIGIEVCSYKQGDVYYFKPQTVTNAINLAKYLCKKYNIGKDNLITHFDVVGKSCPAPFLSPQFDARQVYTLDWEKFKNSVFDNSVNINSSDTVTNNYSIKTVKLTGEVINLKTGDYLNCRSEPNVNSPSVKRYYLGDKLNITGISGDWYQLDNYNYYVHSSYVKLIHWSYESLDKLCNAGLIKDKNYWLDYSKKVTRDVVCTLLARMISPNSIDSAVNILYNNKIITDKLQWDNDMKKHTINKGLFVTLVCNYKGGVSNTYINRVVSKHWADNALDTLIESGIIANRSRWEDLNSELTADLCLALLSKLL